jgi:uncharacterized 2Fe-2S/4Fe-4S cluster protein (DUF4445 family)
MEKKVKVRFPLLNKSIEMPENSKISDACEAIGHPLNLVCGGKGKCKKCAVDIKVDHTIKSVLSCQTNVIEGLQILLKDEDSQAQILTESILKDIHFDPSLSLRYIPSGSLKTDMAGNDWATIEKMLALSLHKPSLGIIQKLSKAFHHPEGITCILDDNILVDVLPGKSEKFFALAVDIGTTSVVGYLYEMKTLELVGIRSRLNKQSQVGGDVISRIDYSVHNPDGLDRLHSLATETVNEIIDNLCNDYQIDKNSIYQATFCGNSTMQHLFLKINPAYLGRIPFSSTTHQEISITASELNININPDGYITFLPLLGGFVGADTTAVLMTLPDDDKNRLVIDLGTNGEIAIGNGTLYKVASAACGPALEGAGLEFGMWGTTGAIERFYIIDGRVSYKVIGDVKPKGICGSGIIDIISELLVNDVITDRGALRNPEQIANADLSKRIIPWDKSKAFVVCFEDETDTGKPILVTQKDIRQVQLAKGAIGTGCHILIEKGGLTLEDIREILVAGAFGNYIDIRNAQMIGMIPYHPGVSVRAIGNAAGTGCQMHVLSREKQRFCHEIAKNAIHIELASDPEFSKQYITNTTFNRVERKHEM